MTLPGAGFIMNPLFEREVCHSAAVRDHLDRIVTEAAPIAKDLAPFDPDDESTWHLGESVVGEVAMTKDGWKGRLTARKFTGLFWEFGTVDHEARPFLRPAIEQLGLQVLDGDGGGHDSQPATPSQEPTG